MMLSTPCGGAEFCRGTCMDTVGDATPKQLPASCICTAAAQPKAGQDQLKSRTHPTHSSPNPGLSSDAMSYACYIPLPAATARKIKGRYGGKMYNPKKQAGAPQQGLCDGS